MNPFSAPHQALILCVLPFLTNCSEKNTFAEPPPTPVGVQSAIIRDQMTYHEFPGHLQALQTVELRARVKGILKTVKPAFQPGLKITKGTALFEINDTPYLAAFQAAESNLAKAKADLAIAEITLKRRLDAGEAISEIQKDTARADVAAAAALVKSAEASVLDAKETLSWCKISAPITGRISELQVDQFNLVGNNEATLLCTIVEDDKLRVYFDIDERMAISFLRTRKAVESKQRPPYMITLTLADGTAYDHPAEIDYADNRLDAQTGTIRVRALVPNPNQDLADGLYVKVKVPSPNPSKDSILIPAIAIQQDLGGHYTLVVGKDNKVLRKNINLGDRVGRLRIIKSGLSGKEKIIVSGIQRVREGMTVAPTEAPMEQPEAAGDTTNTETLDPAAKTQAKKSGAKKSEAPNK